MATHPPAAEALRTIETTLSAFAVDDVPAGSRLECAALTRRLASRLTAISALLIAAADADNESLRRSGTPTSSWLAVHDGLSKREAAGLVHQARDLTARPSVGAAAAAGQISMTQARAIGRVLDGLAGLDAGQASEAESLMLELAERRDADRLASSAAEVLAAVVPERAEEEMERRLQRQAEAAQRNRALTFAPDGNGSVTFSGSLPRVVGEAWLAIIDSYCASQRRTLHERRDPLSATVTPAQRRADALAAMIRAHQQGRRAADVGGDRPRVVLTVSWERLRADGVAAGVMADGTPISAGELRQLCCDADVVPVVMGGPSEVLDVGREARLVTRAIRTALTLRDGGCVFPGCQTRAAACEAHHVQPWWAGGATALSNLALLCHHHHALVEPAKSQRRDQWELQIAPDGVPEALPPKRFDPARRPLRHQRFIDRDRAAGTGVPPPPARAG